MIVEAKLFLKGNKKKCLIIDGETLHLSQRVSVSLGKLRPRAAALATNLNGGFVIGPFSCQSRDLLRRAGSRETYHLP